MKGVEKWLTVLLLVFMFSSFGMNVYAQKYTPTDKGVKIEFSLDNGKGAGEKIKGKFSSLSGDITFDSQHPELSSFDISINAGAASTGDEFNDFKLKAEHYFNAAIFPTIRLKSTAIKKEQSGLLMFNFYGTLTMKGISKPVKMQFTATPFGNGYIFRGMLRINRIDYAVGATGEMGKEVTIFIEVKTKKK